MSDEHPPKDDNSTEVSANEDVLNPKISRRDFLKRSFVVGSGAAALVAAMSPLRLMEESLTAEEFVQKHYKELNKDEMDKVIKRISEKVQKRYGVNPNLRDVKPMDGVEYVYALNLSRCNGSRKCVHAIMNAFYGSYRCDPITNIGFDGAPQAKRISFFKRFEGLDVAIDQVAFFELANCDSGKRPKLQPQALDQRNRDLERIGAIQVTMKRLIVQADIIDIIVLHGLVYFCIQSFENFDIFFFYIG